MEKMKTTFNTMINFVFVLLMQLAFVSSSDVTSTPEDYWRKVMGIETPMPIAVQTLLSSHRPCDPQWIHNKQSLLNYPPPRPEAPNKPSMHVEDDDDKHQDDHAWMTHAKLDTKYDYQWWLHEKLSMSYGKDIPQDKHDDKHDHPVEEFSRHSYGIEGKQNAYAKPDHAPPSHMSNMDPSVNIFFMEKDLKVGMIMPVYFPNRDLSAASSFLPRETSNSIPFSSTQLPALLQHFNFSPHSLQAQVMEDTLKQCESEPIRGETKLCVTSLESMLDFTVGIFGRGTHIQVLTTTHDKKSKILHYPVPLLQNYTVSEVPVKFHASTMVACHSMPYPYAIFYCHQQKSKTEVLKVKMEGENGGRVEVVAVCHFDTSDWDLEHVSFSLLKVKPGTVPICHFFHEDNLIWVVSPPST